MPSAVVEYNGIGVKATLVDETNAQVTNAAASRQRKDSAPPTLNGIRSALLGRGEAGLGAIAACRQYFRFEETKPKVPGRLGL